MQVTGGAGITGNVYAGGLLDLTGTAIVNHGQAVGAAFIAQGVNDSTLLYAKAATAYDAVIVGGNGVGTSFAQGAKLVINSTDSIMLPVGTNAERPGSSGGADTAGMFRYTSTGNTIEWYNGTEWKSATSDFTVIADEQFTGDGIEDTFTLSSDQTTNSCIISINGVIQIPTLAYSVSVRTLTFTEAPGDGDVIDVRKITTTATVLGLEDASGYNTVDVITGTGVVFATGTSSRVEAWTIDTSGAFVSQKANTAIATADTATTIDSFDKTAYRSAKYVVQATSGGKYQVMEALVVHDDTTPLVSGYGIVQTDGNVGILSATISGSTVSVKFIAANANTDVRISKEYMKI